MQNYYKTNYSDDQRLKTVRTNSQCPTTAVLKILSSARRINTTDFDKHLTL